MIPRFARGTSVVWTAAPTVTVKAKRMSWESSEAKRGIHRLESEEKMSTKFYPSKTDCGILVENGDWTFNSMVPSLIFLAEKFFVKNTTGFFKSRWP
jgi:hypothetical protein